MGGNLSTPPDRAEENGAHQLSIANLIPSPKFARSGDFEAVCNARPVRMFSKAAAMPAIAPTDIAGFYSSLLTSAVTGRQLVLGSSKTFKTAVVILLAFVLAGCASPQFTRMPTAWVGHPNSESRAYQQQDPFPDPDIGPDLMSRPRGYSRPRTESRKAAEQRILFGSPNSPEYFRPGHQQGASRRPASVY